MVTLLCGSMRAAADKPGAKPKPPAPAFDRVETARYVVEVPKGWVLSEETPFGQREIDPGEGSDAHIGSMSAMAGPGLGKQSWADLYKTANFYITRYAPDGEKMKATPYRLGKTKHGLESCSWTMVNDKGVLLQRHVILKRSDGDILALSVKLPAAAEQQAKSRLEAMFRHLVDTAVMR